MDPSRLLAAGLLFLEEATRAEGAGRMTQAFWKVYKAKVLQTLGGDQQEEDLQDEVVVSLARGPFFLSVIEPAWHSG